MCFGYLLALGRGTGSNVNDRNVAEGGALRFDTLVSTAEVASSADALKTVKNCLKQTGSNLEGASSIDAFLTNRLAIMAAIIAFIDVNAFSLNKKLSKHYLKEIEL